MPEYSASDRYNKLAANRTMYVTRAEESAKLTIPSLFPPEGSNYATAFPTPWQSIGSQGANNLASKLLLALLPSGTPFFRISPSVAFPPVMDEVKTQINAEIGKAETKIMDFIESKRIRLSAFETFLQIIIAGNCLNYFPPEGGCRVYRLNNYVINRDPLGNPVEIITKESKARRLLPDKIQAMLQEKTTEDNKNDSVDIYTCIERDNANANWEVWQEIEKREISETRGQYPDDRLPWLPLRFRKVDGESYGRGMVEELMGDLRSVETLTQAIVEGSAIAAKCIPLVKPGGFTKVKDLNSAMNGAYVQGNAEDVSFLQVQKFNDFRVALETSNNVERRLAKAFLLNSSVQRQGERVTAEEIRYMAAELESAHAGLYALLAQEYQLPLVKLAIAQLTDAKILNKALMDVAPPTIVTGTDALGRNADLQKLDMFISGAMQTFGPSVIQNINVGNYLTQRATALGINTAGLVKTEQQMAAEQQAQAQAAAAAQQKQNMSDNIGKALPSLINVAGEGAKAQAEQENPQQ